MLDDIKVVGLIFLCLAVSLDAKPRLLREKNGEHFHFTNIGDISSKDILQLAENTSPDSDTLNPQQIDDPYENNIEAETDEFSKTVPITDRPDLASPKVQEEKFVNLLKKQYKGTFPEYGRETKSDFSKNQELEDNLSAQPETVYFGHSDELENDGVNDYPIPDEAAGEQDNLATFDEDAKILNSASMKLSGATLTPHVHSNTDDTGNIQDTTTARPSHSRKHKAQSIEDILSEYNEFGDKTVDDGQSEIENTATTQDYEGHKSVSENDGNFDVSEKAEDENEHVTESMDDNESDKMDDHVTDTASDEMEEHVSEHVADHGTNHMTDDISDDEADQMINDMADHSNKEEKKLKEKTKEEALWDQEEKLREQLAQKKKQKSLRKKKAKLKDQTEKILKDFDQLKIHNAKPNHKILGNEKINQHNLKSDKASKHIKYVHADESQVTGDAILDFLDKLLEKDPKELKHDVLAMTKEMQREGDLSSGSRGESSTAEKEAVNTESSNAMEEKPEVITESSKPSKMPDEVDKWISQLENDIDVGKEEGGKQKENEEANESYDDEEYDQYHEPQDIYPDQNVGKSVQHDEKEKEKESKSDKQIKQDDFDYEEFKEEALKMHNEYRSRHDAVALTWSDSLAKKATSIASKLIDATRTNFKRELEKQGENIAILPYSIKNIAKQAVEKWYAEITKFSFTSPSVKPETRDFTQIIWKNSKEIGMGFVHTTDKKKTLVVALYSPAGNDKNKLQENLNTVHGDPYADIKRNAVKKS